MRSGADVITRKALYMRLRDAFQPEADSAGAIVESPDGESAPWTMAAPELATKADIIACFRLILGRNPNREEWPGHSAKAGEPLPEVVASYLNSLEFSRRGLLERNFMEHVSLAALPGFRIYAADDDIAVGRHVAQDNYERDVTAVFRHFLKPGMNVIDIGANIGYFTMLSASIVGPGGTVLAIEPNPANAKLLEASRRANGFENVTLAQVAAGAQTSLLALHTAHSNGTTSAPSDDLNQLMAAVTVPALRADSLVSEELRIDLIKVDVEGSEFKALQGCETIINRWRPVIVSEFSPDMMAGMGGVDGPTYLRHLVSFGYALHVIEHNGSFLPAASGWQAVMAAYAERGSDHIDIVAVPV
jgi:FkbM family methyltransferase